MTKSTVATLENLGRGSRFICLQSEYLHVFFFLFVCFFSFFLSDVHDEPEEDPGILENIEKAVGKFGHDFSLLSSSAAAAAATSLKSSSIITIIFALFITLLHITHVFN